MMNSKCWINVDVDGNAIAPLTSLATKFNPSIPTWDNEEEILIKRPETLVADYKHHFLIPLLT